jgi:hypothetical protein
MWKWYTTFRRKLTSLWTPLGGLLVNLVEWNLSGTDSRLAGPEFPFLLRNAKIYHRVQKSPLLGRCPDRHEYSHNA